MDRPERATSMRQASSALPARDGEPDQQGNGVGRQYAD